jgi:hypothetical protein
VVVSVVATVMRETSSVPTRQRREPPVAGKADWRRGAKTLLSRGTTRGFPDADRTVGSAGKAKVWWHREDDTG